MTARHRLRMQLVQALTRSESPTVRAHLREALREWEDLPSTPLVKCPVCGWVGFLERLRAHECRHEQ